jgi:diacylglycerol kinase (ATP)
VAIGNCRSYGGGMLITPGASVHDGALDVCIVEAVPRAELLRQLPRVLRGSHVHVDGVRMLRGARVEIAALDSPLGGSSDLWASGEPAGPLPATLEAWPDALRVVV